ncbi:C40 family peptidase [Allobranchiibius huperziae]|uniref:Cell wall-associated NlpC family hydrolase n=1 Tax=Allobranchiibius huperziae TaxID=1874116 RepID=A0A853DDR1_9MICO|nr:C40 family peptidase [Allobranchiibius huperziae]NYJ74133.1 cell wall-associated NlpC family hydrolase [Allobranchiibius huperziae]
MSIRTSTRTPLRILTVAGLTAAIGVTTVGHGMSADAATRSFPAKVTLNGRQHIGDSANAKGAVVDKYKAGRQVPVTCQAAHKGTLWDRTTDKLWVPDKYLTTGTDGYVSGMSKCAQDDGSLASKRYGRIDGPRGPQGGTHAQKVDRVIAAATSQTGKGLTYSWGAGGKGGPAYGVGTSPSGYHDSNRFGFDCSGFTLYAFWKGAGVDVGSNTTAQYAHAHRVKRSQMQRGDLVFWGSGSSTHHVAIYLGKGRILEADVPRDSHSVREASLSAPGSDLMPYVVRPV